MPCLTLPMTLEEFRQLPRHPAYRYEHLNGVAHLTPYAKHYHAVLDLHTLAAVVPVQIRKVDREDFPRLADVFSGAFHRTQPFASLDDELRHQAAREALERTRTGRDGPWIERASFVALEQETLIGAIFITLLPEGDLSDWSSFSWDAPPAADAVERRLGRPHLTWVFVSPLRAAQGVGTALLSAATCELLSLGFTDLVSTFMLGNESSTLWHWRNGFRLLEHPGSLRRWRQRRDQRHV